MSEQFHELVVEGPLQLIKGCVAGILASEGLSMESVLFAEEHPIRGESLLEQVGEWFHLHQNLSHLLIPMPLYPSMRQRLEKAEAMIGLRTKSDRPIRSASFRFSYAVYAKKHFEEIEALLASCGRSIRFSGDYQPAEQVDPAGAGDELYTAAHYYEAQGAGDATGDLDDILALYHRVSEVGMMKLSKIELHHPDD